MTLPAIPFGDFHAHVAALRTEIDAAVREVLSSGWFILGPQVEAFERELASALGAADAVAVGNGTDALQIALQAQGIGPGDDVVTTPLTAAFTALAIAQVGARPIFADLDPRTLTVSAETLERALTPKTKALIPVHLYGHPVDLDPILDLARAKNLAVIEDACQAHGARYKDRTVGSIAPLGALSFYPTKNLGAFGDGGGLLVRERPDAVRLRQLRNGGQSDRYRHEIVGMNSRLDEMQAAVLRVKLRHLAAWTERRRALAALYTAELQGSAVAPLVEAPYARSAWHLFVVRHPERDRLMAALKAQGIATLIHYPIPLHLQPCFAGLGGRAGDLPVAEKAAAEIFSLPLYPEMEDEPVRRVARAIRELAPLRT